SPPIGNFFLAVGRPHVNFQLSLSIVPFYLGAIWFGASWGIVGIATGITVVRTLFGMAGFEIVARHLGVRFRDVVRPLMLPLGASILMGMIVFPIEAGVSALFEGAHVLELLLLVAVGAVVYVLLLRSLFNNLAREPAMLTNPLLGKYQ